MKLNKFYRINTEVIVLFFLFPYTLLLFKISFKQQQRECKDIEKTKQ